jgi:hypothetical protein
VEDRIDSGNDLVHVEITDMSVLRTVSGRRLMKDWDWPNFMQIQRKSIRMNVKCSILTTNLYT